MLIKIPQNLINNFGGERFWSLIDLILYSYDRPSLDFERVLVSVNLTPYYYYF